MDFEHVVWAHVAELFHRHDGTMEGGDTGNLHVTSSTGLRFPFGGGLSATAQVDVDYDNQPAPGATSTDTTYLMTLGYSW